MAAKKKPQVTETRRAAHHGVPARRSAHHMLLFRRAPKKRTWWIAAGIVVVLGAAVAFTLFYTELDWRQLQRAFARLGAAMNDVNAAAMIPLMAVLPVFGFPIGLVYVAAGARFGPWLGGVVVTVVTVVHLLLTWAIARSVLRRPLEWMIAKRHQQLPHVPDDEQAAVSLIAVLVPGIPYFVRNYLLALAGVRLRIYFWICLPIYVARSYVAIMLGDMSDNPSGRTLLILVGVDGLKLVVCAFVIWRLRQHHRKFHGHEHGPHLAGGLAAPPKPS
jgi:uncharacterized membrane protein YdjX (TVP38/TMEM64 family)